MDLLERADQEMHEIHELWDTLGGYDADDWRRLYGGGNVVQGEHGNHKVPRSLREKAVDLYNAGGTTYEKVAAWVRSHGYPTSYSTVSYWVNGR